MTSTSPITSTSLRPGEIGGFKTRKAADDNQRPCLLIYGEGGIGKTTLAASACEVPDLSPVLHLNIENGAQSLEEKYGSHPELEIVDVPNIVALQSIYKDLYNGKGLGYETVILDNLTEGQSLGLDYILTGLKTAGDFVEFEGATFANGAWNRSSEQMRKLMRYFRNLPMNVVFIAWKKDYSGPNDTQPKYGPAFTKTFGGEAPGMVNDVYHYYVKGGQRILQTSATERAIAKDRTNKLPQIITNPTMEIIHNYWTGKLVKEEATPATKPTTSVPRRVK